MALCVSSMLWLLSVRASVAQNTPIVSGGVGFLDSTNTGINFFQPVVAPLVVVPIGRHLLAESRFDFREVYATEGGKNGPYKGTFFKSTQYLQLDYLAASHLTLTVCPALSLTMTRFRVKKGACAPLRFNNMLSWPATGTTCIVLICGEL